MTDYPLSLLLGVIEGLTEFLPVSSTAHLRITEALLGVSLSDGYWKMFSIVIQLGAVCCLPIYFRAEIRRLLAGGAGSRSNGNAAPSNTVVLTLAAFICTAVPSFLLVKVIGKHLESLTVMGWALIIGGVIMWVVDALYQKGRIPRRTEQMETMSMGQAVWIGLCQNLSAIFPGTSRSMSTIAAGQIVGMSRAAALEFSFFLSIPTMFAATGYDLLKSLRRGPSNPLGAPPMTGHGWAVLALGFIVSFIVAYGVVAWFMAWVRKRGFVPFAIYRLAAGGAVLLWLARGT
ncbi:MAG TPA: undecaprenyl-diphosphate phosphatase [Gemmatimonadales bacterium]|jgi:undecaprenyl-diphosphatase